jgi:hypothetical protein
MASYRAMRRTHRRLPLVELCGAGGAFIKKRDAIAVDWNWRIENGLSRHNRGSAPPSIPILSYGFPVNPAWLVARG